MTVLVGMLCQDGVVIGADSSATLVAGRTPTVEQPTSKIRIIKDKAILAGNGSVGLYQRFGQLIENLNNNKIFSKSPIDVGKIICKHAQDDFSSTNLNAPFPFGGLVAYHHNKQFYLFEFEDGSLQPEQKDNHLWYVSMGSGQRIADPFLGLMRRAFCPNCPPNLSTGIFITAWTLDHTIDVNPGGIKGPIQIAVIKEEEGSLVARELTGDELAEHTSNVSEAYKYLSQYPDLFSGNNVPDIPTTQPPN